MRSRGRFSVILALAVSSVAWAGEGAERARLLAALRDAVDSLAPQPSPRAPRTGAAGDVTVDYAANSRALNVLAEAQRLEQDGDWKGAAALLQRLLDEAPDALCQKAPRLYIPLGDRAEERLADFPPEGLRAYRLLADAAARRLLDDAVEHDDRGGLGTVASRYLLSSVGDEALDRLATAWLARGEAGRALRAWQRLVRRCRDTDVDPAAIAAKLAVCYHELGRDSAARTLVARFVEAAGDDATLRVAGKPLRLADLAAGLAALPATPPDDAWWPMARGSRDQARVAPTPMRPGTLQWSDVIQSRAAAEAIRTPRYGYDPFARYGQREPTVLIQPIVAHGQLIYPSRVGLLARDLAAGKMAWSMPWPRHQGDRIMLDPFTHSASWPGRWSASADRKRVYVSVPLHSPTPGRQSRIGGEMVAIDPRAGRPIWRRRVPADLPAATESGWYASAPLPCGDRLVVGLRAGASGEEFHLLGLRAGDGRRLWRTYMCSRTPEPWYYAQLRVSWFDGMPAESEGLAVACPGGGAVGAVELATGRPRWLARYDQLQPARGSHYRLGGWRSHTPIVADGIVYVTPPDSEFLYAFGLHSGTMLWRVERKHHRHLVAVRGGRAYLAGSHAACVGPRGAVEWETALPASVVGRPALAGRILHLPVAGGIVYLDAETGGELAWTAWEQWRQSHGPIFTADLASGDVLVAAGRLLVVTPYTLNVFDAHEPRRALEAEVPKRPDDPSVQRALAEELHWQGDAAAAAARFEKALALATARPGRVPEGFAAEARQRLATCHHDLARRHERAGRLEPALAATRDALRHAADPSLRSTLLRGIASLAQRLRRWPEAVDACQQVLADATAHGAHWRAARDGLDALLRQAGREHYARHEAAAEALAKGHEADWHTVVRRYPNSLAAPRVLLRLAAAAEAAGRHADARRWLHSVVSDYPEADGVPQALYRLAAGYARLGSPAMTRGALAVLRARHPAWKVPADADALLARHAPKQPARAAPAGPPFTVGWQARPDYGALRLHAVGDPRGARDAVFLIAGLSLESRDVADGSMRWADRPGWIGIEIRDAPRRGGGVTIGRVVPRTPGDRAGLRSGDTITGFGAQRIRDSQELIVTCMARRSGAAVAVRLLRDGKEIEIPVTLGARPAQRDEAQLDPGALLGAAAGHALLRQPTRLDALRLADGAVAWSAALDEPAHAPEGGATSAADGAVVALADSRARLVALDPADGHELWSHPLDEPTVHRVALWRHGLVLATSAPATLRVVNAFSGETRFHAAEPHAAAAPRFVLDSRDRLCYAMGSALGCYDGRKAERLWTDRIRNFTAHGLLAAGDAALAYGEDRHGAVALECRRLDTGEALWSRSLARGERLLHAAADERAVYLVSRRAARTTVRRLDLSTGESAWAHELGRNEELVDWETTGLAVALGVTAPNELVRDHACVVAVDRMTGAVRQRLDLGPGRLVSLTAVADAYYAVVEDDARELAARFDLGGIAIGEPARFRVVRVVGEP